MDCRDTDIVTTFKITRTFDNHRNPNIIGPTNQDFHYNEIITDIEVALMKQQGYNESEIKTVFRDIPKNLSQALKDNEFHN
ncbi:unnamed protein product [Ambrosiozyma monospora]|uniref:Unnamed protein product n=1 Tax=Ambrosiozyma monospora TaxID=43982 RepID=A0A9W6WGU1_AMBMO|nr:unnamed protein product [Ambrosiozyma monospora]GME78368.1 unnamed protein product [Ambrosiozyma monospora]GME84017.1 unnamed protein product [Ambrosiozyma monospora]